jgi:hypothetical protein
MTKASHVGVYNKEHSHRRARCRHYKLQSMEKAAHLKATTFIRSNAREIFDHHSRLLFYGGHRDILRKFVSISPDEAKWTKFRLSKSTKRQRGPYAAEMGGGGGGSKAQNE